MIDRNTVERIKEAANIVDVVSEFVTLRKSGANFKGLCPFHDEKTPSFVVTPSRGTCHCFGCGKGGNAISFIMEHEQLTYPEALRWLAKKYNIEIKEREITDSMKREQNERESMFIVNEWAASYFSDILHNNVDGLTYGMQYFRSRGFRDDIINKFRLGYSVPDRKALGMAALSRGYKEKYIIGTGLCYQSDRGELIDRYSGRVIFPWVGLSGKIVGFGGRLLDQRTKGVAQKYVNSPQSEIYHKDHELYGIFQAKKAIAKEDHVYLVEGYTDVISLHQCGIENVVANSGTALSIHQIHMLHRFTSNITLLYDGDAAGIHAAMRGTDMLLSEGMNLRVLLLPDGEDPDSFARKHTLSEFVRFVNEKQTDFIHFKMRLMLENESDPAKRSEAINSIIQSVAYVADPILRDTYIHECSSYLRIPEETLINTMNRFIRESRNKAGNSQTQKQLVITVRPATSVTSTAEKILQAQKLLIKAVVKDGDRIVVFNAVDESGNMRNLTVAEYVHYNLMEDNLIFDNELYNRILASAVKHSGEEGFVAVDYFVHNVDIEISKLASSLITDEYQLIDGAEDADSRKNDVDELRQLIDHLLIDYRFEILDEKMAHLKRMIADASSDTSRLMKLMGEYKQLQSMRNMMARKVGRRLC